MVAEAPARAEDQQDGEGSSRIQLQSEASSCLINNGSRCRIDLSSISTISLEQRNPLSVDTSYRQLSLLDTSRLQEELRLARYNRRIGQVRARDAASARSTTGSRRQQAVRRQTVLPHDRLHLRSQAAEQLRLRRARGLRCDMSRDSTRCSPVAKKADIRTGGTTVLSR